MKSQMDEFFKSNDLYPKFQSGYRTYHSTSTAVLNVCDDIRRNINKKQITTLALLDFSKAFDSINHQILCYKLNLRFKFSKSAIKLVYSYLCNRTQLVEIDNDLSSELPVPSGVPQGSVLGPLLFCLYISDISEHILDCNFHMFADDLQVYRSCHLSDIEVCVQKINNDLERIHNYAIANSLHLNASKSQSIVIYNKAIDTDRFPRLYIQNEYIPYSGSVKNLGVILNKSLQWDDHVLSVSKRIHGILSSLWKAASGTDWVFRRRLFMSYVFPHFLYADAVLFGMSERCKSILNKCFNSSIRFIFALRKYDHLSMFKKQVIDIDLFEFRVCDLLRRLIQSHEPSYLYNKLTLSRNFSFDFRLIPATNSSAHLNKSLFVGGIAAWNALPLDVKKARGKVQFYELFKNYKNNQIYT